jgi:hypothetical protein
MAEGSRPIRGPGTFVGAVEKVPEHHARQHNRQGNRELNGAFPTISGLRHGPTTIQLAPYVKPACPLVRAYLAGTTKLLDKHRGADLWSAGSRNLRFLPRLAEQARTVRPEA